jgi:esterase
MKLFFRKYGNGPPIIILHGLYGSSDNWVTIARSLSAKFTVYLPDQRNHGQSPHSDIHDYDAMCQDLFDLIQEINIRKFVLAGHSMGGKVAVNFAMKWPEMINSLIIIDISPLRSSDTEKESYKEHQKILESLLSIDLSKIRSRKDVETSLVNSIDSERTRGFIMKNLQRTSENSYVWKMNVKALYNNLAKIADGLPGPIPGTEPVTGFSVIFIKGENSDYLSSGEFILIQKLFPAAEMITIKNAGHWVHAERPDEVIKILMGSLNG